MRKRQDPMLFISKCREDYRIKIKGHDQGLLVSVILYKWQYETDAKTKKAAKLFRDEVLQELEDKRIFSISWTPNVMYFINGLYLELNGQRVVARTPNDKGLPQRSYFSINRFGLREAFDMAISELEKNKRRKTYPDWVISKAWKIARLHYGERL